MSICGGWSVAGSTPKKFAMPCCWLSGQFECRRRRADLRSWTWTTARCGAANCKRFTRPRTSAASICRSYAAIVPDILQVFDAADPSLIVGKRDVTTVPTQALFLMNNPFVLQAVGRDGETHLDRQGSRPGDADRHGLPLGALAPGHRRRSMRAVAKYLNEYRQKRWKARATRSARRWRPGPACARHCFESGEFRYVY